MSAQPVPDDVLQAVAALYVEHGGNKAAAARAGGYPHTSFYRYVEKAAKRGFLSLKPVMPGFEISRTSSVLDKDGGLTRTYVTQQPERDDFTPPAGFVPSRVSALVDGRGRVINQWQRFDRADTHAACLVEGIREAISEHRSASPVSSSPIPHDEDLLTVYPLPDLHIGSRSWGAETGENWDLDIACETFRRACADLVAQSRPSRHAVVLGLGDYFHLNDRTNMTPKSGHVLDVDGRWPKVLKSGVRLALDLITMAAQKHDRVEVRFIPGNHDPDAAVALTVALGIYYDGHPRISVTEDASHHWYRRFGKVLLGATHGHTMKPDRMALMLASDNPEDWGASRFRHFMFGHVHHETAKEVGSVKVESFNSPAAKDAYAHAGGWRAGRSLNALTFHRERGEVGRHRTNLFLEGALS